jgi:glutaredoxin
MKNNMYTVYGKENCIYCVKAKELLTSMALPFEYHDVMKDIEQRSIMLGKLTNVKTLPQIFVNDDHIGGYSELATSISQQQ